MFIFIWTSLVYTLRFGLLFVSLKWTEKPGHRCTMEVNITSTDAWEVLILKSRRLRVILASMMALAAVCGTTGYCLKLYIFLRHCRGDQRKKYLFGIALAALIICLMYYPLFILELLRPDIIFDNLELCLLTKYVKMFSFLFYIFSILIVSVWNYIFFAYPLKGRIWIKRSRVALVWTTAITVAAVIAGIGYILMERPRTTKDAFLCWNLNDRSSSIFIKVVLLAVVLPCLGMAVYFNAYVYSLACRVRTSLHMRVPGQPASSYLHHLKNCKGKKQTCLTAVIFLFTWVPFFTVISLRVFCRTCVDMLVMFIVGDLSFFLASFVPLLMFLMTTKYRRTLLHVLSCGRKGGPLSHGGSTRYDKSSSTAL